MSFRTDTRFHLQKKIYKLGMDTDEARRKRDDNFIQIRKNGRTDIILKKRREGMQQVQSSGSLESLSEMVAAVWSDDNSLQLKAAIEFQELLSGGNSPPIDEVINAGVVPRFVQFLAYHNVPLLQSEAAWTLTNIASGSSEHVRVVVDHGAVPLFVHLLMRSPCIDVRENAVWALGNIAGDKPLYNDLVLRHGALKPLLNQINHSVKPSMLRIVSWALCNMCKGKPQVVLHQISPVLAALKRLSELDDEEVLKEACWALSHLTVGSDGIIQTVTESGVCPRLLELLQHPSPHVVVPAISTVGNILSGDDGQTQFMIDNRVLPFLLDVLTKGHCKNIRRKACWGVSNITAGTEKQIQAVIDANIIPLLIQLLLVGELNVKKEAAWAVSNAVTGGSQEQINYLVNEGCVRPLCDMLDCADPTIVHVCLEAIGYILEAGEAEVEIESNEGLNRYVQYVEDAGGVEKIERLQNHNNYDIYEKAVTILEAYWEEDHSDD